MLIPVLIGMTLVVFSIIRFIPGNPAQVILGQRATKSSRAIDDSAWFRPAVVRTIWSLHAGALKR